MEQSQVTPERFEVIKKLMESELDYSRALDRLTSWVSYLDRLEVSKDMQEIETVIRRAWYADSEASNKLYLSVLGDKERRRERWCRYAAAALSCHGIDASFAARNADALLVEEEARFGKTAEDPEQRP